MKLKSFYALEISTLNNAKSEIYDRWFTCWRQPNNVNTKHGLFIIIIIIEMMSALLFKMTNIRKLNQWLRQICKCISCTSRINSKPKQWLCWIVNSPKEWKELKENRVEIRALSQLWLNVCVQFWKRFSVLFGTTSSTYESFTFILLSLDDTVSENLIYISFEIQSRDCSVQSAECRVHVVDSGATKRLDDSNFNGYGYGYDCMDILQHFCIYFIIKSECTFKYPSLWWFQIGE